MFKCYRKIAFTLAEVLITIGIIGVVAVITMSTLITHYQKEQTVTRLKAAYSIVQQAVKLSEAENGDAADWDINKEGSFEQYVLPYLSIADKNKIRYSSDEAIVYYECSGSRETKLAVINTPKYNSKRYTLANGVDLLVLESGRSFDILVDINGAMKKPNKYGRDAFYFVFNAERRNFFPVGMYSTHEFTVEEEGHPDEDFLRNDPSTTYRYGCNKKSIGIFCGALILINGWEIPDDYPW